MDKENFYGELGESAYLPMVRAFVPGYDEIVQKIKERVLDKQSKKVLDIGCGIGNIAKNILEESNNMELTCIDPAEGLVDCTKTKLKEYGNVKVLKTSIQDFETTERFDVIYSNLVLHNVPMKEKKETLKKIYSLLELEGIFIWGDLILYKTIKSFFWVYLRHFIALFKGSGLSFSLNDLRKETKEDAKLTIKQTKEICEEIGFEKFCVIWEKTYGTIAMFEMQRIK
jgi:2-polyprenyl-3-methyl-5-hydroxy-6-metoxy-1,4-benzoquinol methylase